MDVIKILEISADIPNDGVQFVTSFDAELQLDPPAGDVYAGRGGWGRLFRERMC